MLLIPRSIWTIENFNKLAKKFVAHQKSIVFFLVIITALAVLAAKGLRIDSNYMAFLPESFPGVQNLKKVIEKTGGFGNFMILIEGGTPDTRRIYAKHLSDSISEYPWVDYVEYKKDREKIEKSKLLFLSTQDLSEIEARINHYINFKKNPATISFLGSEDVDPSLLDFSDIEKKYQQFSFGSDYYEDAQLKYTVVIVWPKGSMTNLDFARSAYHDLSRLIQLDPAKVYHQEMLAQIGGEYRSKIDEYDSLIQNVLGSVGLTFVLIALVLYLHYKRMGVLFYIFIPLLLGTVWTAGLGCLVVGRLNLLTVFLVVILFGMGIDYGIYLFSGYTSYRREGISQIEAIAQLWFGIGKTVISSAWTTALAFFVLVFTDFKGFQEFGFLASMGVILILLSYILVSPLIWIYAEKWHLFHPAKHIEQAWWPKFNYSSKMLLLVSVATLFSFYGLFQVEYEYDYANLRSLNNSYWNLNSKLHAVFPLSKTPAIVLADSQSDAKELVAHLRSKLKDFKTVDTIRSIVDFLPDHIQEKKIIMSRIKTAILSQQTYLNQVDRQKLDSYLNYLNPDPIKLADLPRSMLRTFMGRNQQEGVLVFIYDKVRLSDIKNALLYASEIRKINVGEKTYYPAEGSLLFADTLVLMKKESLFAFLFMLLIVFGNLLLDTRSLKEAIIVFMPLILSFVLTLGLMPFFNLKINIFNLVLFPILIGMGDDALLQLHHHLHAKTRLEEMNTVLTQVGGGISLALLTTIIGFGSMVLADHQGLRSLALVACLGLASLGLSTLVVAPLFYKLRLNRN